MKICPKCKTNNEGDFCTNCGRDLSYIDNVSNANAYNYPCLPKGYSYSKSLNLKSGKTISLINVLAIVLMIVSIVINTIIFEFDDFSSRSFTYFVIDLTLGALIAIGGLMLGMLLQLIIYKAVGAGRIKLNVGLIVELSSEKAIKRNQYIFMQFFVMLFPIGLLCVFSIIYFNSFVFLALLINIANLIANIPILVYVFKCQNTSLVHFYKGSLSIFNKDIV